MEKEQICPAYMAECFDVCPPGSVPSWNAGQAATKATFIAAAIRKCGGNEEKGRLLYTAYGSTGQVCFLICILLYKYS